MATFKHPGLPGQLASGYSEDAAAILAASGWVDVNAPEPEPEASGYTGWSKDQLKAEADSRGLPQSGNKDDLIDRILADDEAAGQPAEEA